MRAQLKTTSDHPEVYKTGIVWNLELPPEFLRYNEI